MAQAVHAAFEFSVLHPEMTRAWQTTSNYLVIVGVPDEAALIGLASRALERGITTHTVHEPDLGDQATAVVLEPGDAARRLCSSLPLALKTPMQREVAPAAA